MRIRKGEAVTGVGVGTRSDKWGQCGLRIVAQIAKSI